MSEAQNPRCIRERLEESQEGGVQILGGVEMGVKVTLGLWLRWPGGQWHPWLEEGQLVVEDTRRQAKEEVPGISSGGWEVAYILLKFGG